MSKETYLRIQEQFYDACQEIGPYAYQGLEYEQYQLAGKMTGLDWTIINLNIRSFTLGLINTLNQYTLTLFKLEAWKMVLDRSDQQTSLNLLGGTVTPLAEWLLSVPWRFREKLIYCATILLNNAEEMIADPLGPINEKSINFKSLKNHQAPQKLQLDITDLLNHISGINKGEIAEYRNELNHRIPQNIELGHSVIVVRSPSGKSHGLSGRSPIRIEEIIPLLRAEQERLKAACEAYWRFIKALVQCFEKRNA